MRGERMLRCVVRAREEGVATLQGGGQWSDAHTRDESE